jgi:hypothetical protein
MTSIANPIAPPQARAKLGEWRRLIVTVVLVFIPFLLAFAWLEYVAWRIGETRSMRWEAAWQSAGPDREWRSGDARNFLTFKLARTELLKPEILVIGASRTAVIEGDMLRPYTFYNAGFSAWTLNQLHRAIELITASGYAPKAMIITFDYWMFSNGFDQKWTDRFYEEPNPHFDSLKLVADQLWKTSELLEHLQYTDRFQGNYAVVNANQSFRADGSLSGTPGLVFSDDPKRLADDGIHVGNTPVETGDAMDPRQIENFQRLVALAKAKHITLIGVQMPMYAKILDDLNSNPQAGIWREFESPERARFFNDAGLIFFDFSNAPGYSGKAHNFADSIHPTEPLAHHVMEIVATDPRVRAALPEMSAPAAK